AFHVTRVQTCALPIFAYTYTKTPPRHVRPASNVIIRLCPLEALRDRPMSDPVNAPFANLLQSWSRIAPSLFVWDYTTNFSNFIRSEERRVGKETSPRV